MINSSNVSCLTPLHQFNSSLAAAVGFKLTFFHKGNTTAPNK